VEHVRPFASKTGNGYRSHTERSRPIHWRRRGAHGRALGADLGGDAEDSIPDLHSIHFPAGKEIHVVRPAVIEVKERERAATGEKETPLLGEPRQ